MSLEQLSDKKSNNLQIMKYIAACLVIISHAYPLCGGADTKDFLYNLTNGQLSLGGLAVALFFLCGGFFISKSIEHKNNGYYFWKTRICRICPPLWCIVIISIIVGAFITTMPIQLYLTSSDTWLYLLNGIFIPVHNLPGVFLNAPYNPTVNGALWTLSVEVVCYFFCFICYKLGFFNEKKFNYIIASAILLMIFLLATEIRYPSLMQIIRPVVLFVTGMGFWINRKNIKINKKSLLPLTFILMLSFIFKLANIGIFLIFPMWCFTLWFGIREAGENVAKLGDASYGMYLSGFVIQQLIVYLFGNHMNYYVNMLIAIIIATMIGFMLNHIEIKVRL